MTQFWKPHTITSVLFYPLEVSHWVQPRLGKSFKELLEIFFNHPTHTWWFLKDVTSFRTQEPFPTASTFCSWMVQGSPQDWAKGASPFVWKAWNEDCAALCSVQLKGHIFKVLQKDIIVPPMDFSGSHTANVSGNSGNGFLGLLVSCLDCWAERQHLGFNRTLLYTHPYSQGAWMRNNQPVSLLAQA